MPNSNRFKMSQERYDELKKELDYSKTTRADEIAELIKEARGFGDLSENSEYDEAKNEQGLVESRIIFLENGGICEEGTHEQLLQQGGGYAKLFEIQSRYYKEGKVF